MSERKKQQVRIGDEWCDVVFTRDCRDVDGCRYIEYLEGGKTLWTLLRKPEFRDTPAAPEPPKEVWVNVYTDGTTGAAMLTEEQALSTGKANCGGITRRYVLPK